ncbi:MAG: HAD-IC family P-type ATPase, partial [Bacilli bacterium]|nr:HAD-IC family P-type ATPase [Bacilli bacterium]
MSASKQERPKYEDPSLSEGLSSQEAAKRKAAGYDNRASVKVEKSYFKIVVDNVFSIFAVVLYLIAILFMVFNFYLRSTGEIALAEKYFGISKFGFLGPLTINIIIGIVQEIRSKIVLDNLKLMHERHAKVIRDGQILSISTNDIVLGDLIVLSQGEQAPCDVRVLEGACEVDESFLTGESESVQKTSMLKQSAIYSGSAIIAGQVKAVVSEVGYFTYINQIGKKLKKIQKTRSELMRNIYTILDIMAVVLFVIVLTVLGTLIYKVNKWGGDVSVFPTPLSLSDIESWAIITVTTSAFAIGVIPTGLLLMTSLTLTSSVIHLANHHTLIQELFSLESLSRVDTICLDKTGTLTDETMELVDADYFGDKEEAINYLRILLGTQPTRNATSEALFKAFGSKQSQHLASLIPFSSARKYAGAVFEDGLEINLGAPEALFPDDLQILKIAIERASNGYRVLGLKKNGEPLALFYLKDGLRKSAPETIAFFNENGVDVKIISGDNINTVKKIAELCGVLHSEKAINLAGLGDDEVRDAATKYTIFARVSPEQKEILVSALQEQGRKVAMTGDGVNDILALRKANASITFQKATDAAKSCADVVLLDNDFAHLREVVNQGRKVVNNTQRTAILFLMKTICIASLAFFLIPFHRGQMYYTIEDIYLVQTAVMAIGGFLLSLEPSKKPIVGSFQKNVYLKALAAGIFLLIASIIP